MTPGDYLIIFWLIGFTGLFSIIVESEAKWHPPTEKEKRDSDYPLADNPSPTFMVIGMPIVMGMAWPFLLIAIGVMLIIEKLKEL